VRYGKIHFPTEEALALAPAVRFLLEGAVSDPRSKKAAKKKSDKSPKKLSPRAQGRGGKKR